MAIEYELKFQATEAVLEQILAEYGNNPCQTFQMETTYYDTPDRRLGKLHWTLRRRFENGTSVCTVKTPSKEGGRGEWETEAVFIENAIDALIADGAPKELKALTKEGLFPICGAKFTRLAKTVVLEDTVAELALDHGYLFSGDRKAPLCEVELELKSGDKESFDRYVLAFAKRFDLEEEKTSKFARALQLYRGE